MRNKIVAGNWKMNLTLEEGFRLAGDVRQIIEKESLSSGVILCTPFIHLNGISKILEGSHLETGAQNCSTETSGAYTGEVSAQMIKSTGAGWVIIGHSERRSLFAETNEQLLRKTNAALDAGLRVIFCCGELLAEREAGLHFETVKRQLDEGLFSLSESRFKEVVIAYEPVWAIGTGVTATPGQAQEMHKYLREQIEKVYGKSVAQSTILLYGGSCKASNAAELFANPDVDGGLIGGASLKAEEFRGIIMAAG
ncbi:MAG: triose-phosphate isomerase [Bacteroidales bacterium]